MRKQRIVLLSLATAAALAVTGCSSGSPEGGEEDNKLTVWTVEDIAERVTAQEEMLAAFTEDTGVDVELVAIAEDQLTTVLTSAAAANELPDLIGALSLNGVNQLYSDDLVDTEAAASIIESLGADTFTERALELTSDGDTPLAIPSDGWAQLLFYRTDLFDAAGLEAPTTYESITAAAKQLTEDGHTGIVAGTAPSDSFTQQTFEHFALANGCDLVDDDGEIALDSDECVEAFDFFGQLMSEYSAAGNQDADTTRASYFAGNAGMVVWSSFLLDELAGLRNDALPTCGECAADPGFLAANTGVVSAIEGPSGPEPASFGEIVSWAVLQDASPNAQDLVEHMMGEAYTDWLAIAPEGKVPTRNGTKENPTEFTEAWQSLEAGVDEKALLEDVFGEETLQAVAESPDSFSRWGFPQGQATLAGAVSGQFVVPQALAKVINSGTSAADAAKEAADNARTVQEDLGL
jgi:multiple sugar transport system substrate-binding protein